MGGGAGPGDRIVFADVPDEFVDVAPLRPPLPPPAFGFRTIEGSRSFETVVSIPQDHEDAYEEIVERVRSDATGPVAVEGHANAVALGARVRRPFDGGEAIGTGCAYLTTADGPQLLTCAHVLVDLLEPDNTAPLEIHDPAGQSPMAATITITHIPSEAIVNDLDVGLAKPSRTTGLSPNRATVPRAQIIRGDLAAKWGTVTNETHAVVHEPDLANFGVEYPECWELVRFTRLYRLYSPEPFGSEGDSGALVWHEPSKEAIGMLIAAADAPNKVTGLWASYVLPMAAILSSLKASLT